MGEVCRGSGLTLFILAFPVVVVVTLMLSKECAKYGGMVPVMLWAMVNLENGEKEIGRDGRRAGSINKTGSLRK